ncbi:prenylated RAB acceptor 1.A1 [Striga asiatica]|uniref:PRA1 family protein n=1 Tax=Striga asiatica TaxID=4170 RepID=A0A5A7QS36_STRAF|nr:prenylated RAB acceptor 1.A1 [Striga asiatica]
MVDHVLNSLEPLFFCFSALSCHLFNIVNVCSCSFAGTFSEKGHEDCQTVFSSFGSKDETSSHVNLLFEGAHLQNEQYIYVDSLDGYSSWYFLQDVLSHVNNYAFLFRFAVSFFLWFASCGILMVLWAFAIGLLATLIHASFRTPNLKARLNTFREEFRAVWHNYSEL